jgi:hypothetical protein
VHSFALSCDFFLPPGTLSRLSSLWKKNFFKVRIDYYFFFGGELEANFSRPISLRGKKKIQSSFEGSEKNYFQRARKKREEKRKKISNIDDTRTHERARTIPEGRDVGGGVGGLLPNEGDSGLGRRPLGRRRENATRNIAISCLSRPPKVSYPLIGRNAVVVPVSVVIPSSFLVVFRLNGKAKRNP